MFSCYSYAMFMKLVVLTASKLNIHISDSKGALPLYEKINKYFAKVKQVNFLEHCGTFRST